MTETNIKAKSPRKNTHKTVDKRVKRANRPPLTEIIHAYSLIEIIHTYSLAGIIRIHTHQKKTSLGDRALATLAAVALSAANHNSNVTIV